MRRSNNPIGLSNTDFSDRLTAACDGSWSMGSVVSCFLPPEEGPVPTSRPLRERSNYKSPAGQLEWASSTRKKFAADTGEGLPFSTLPKGAQARLSVTRGEEDIKELLVLRHRNVLPCEVCPCTECQDAEVQNRNKNTYVSA